MSSANALIVTTITLTNNGLPSTTARSGATTAATAVGMVQCTMCTRMLPSDVARICTECSNRLVLPALQTSISSDVGSPQGSGPIILSGRLMGLGEIHGSDFVDAPTHMITVGSDNTNTNKGGRCMFVPEFWPEPEGFMSLFMPLLSLHSVIALAAASHKWHVYLGQAKIWTWLVHRDHPVLSSGEEAKELISMLRNLNRQPTNGELIKKWGGVHLANLASTLPFTPQQYFR
jgi:hypothetical protein